jgi:neutral/alkaline ceramidase-like enzyme
VSRRLWVALGAALMLAAAPAAAQPCPDCLEAGAGRAPLGVPAGTPLAGYGSSARRLLFPDVFGRQPHAFWFQPSQGMREPLAARALVLQSADHWVAWVALDLLAVDRVFTAEVDQRLRAAGVPPLTLIISASHTHSGPGAFVDSELMGLLTLDRLDGAVRKALLDAVVAAIRQADAARRPARLATGSAVTPPLVRSRLRQALDPEMLVVRVTGTQNEPVAVVWNYAIHGTTLGPRNLLLSGDVMGEASARLEQALGVPVLFVNGAVGDVSPAHHGERAVAEVGAELAAVAQDAWAAATPVPRPRLAVGLVTATLPAPRLPLRNCLRGWAPRWLTLPLGAIFPRETTLTAVAVGDTGWVTFPGEPQTSLGRAIKEAAAVRHPLVAGLSNDYLGYFVGAADYDRPTYLSCATIYGPETGGCLAGAAAELLSAVARGQQTPGARVPCDRDAGAR